jgi:hypothetical protein
MFIESMFAIGLVGSMALLVIAAMEQIVQAFYEENMAVLKHKLNN